MAGIFNEDDSTDDEIGINLQLAERLRINREHCKFIEDEKLEDSKDLKQLCNMQRKTFVHNSHSSSSSSLEIQNDEAVPGSTCSDSYHNKKRQNGDKNIEQLANPKRTCLSDRFYKSPDWRALRKIARNKESQLKNCKFSEPSKLQSAPSPDLFPDKKGEDHMNSLADAEDSDFELPIKITRNSKKSCAHGSKTHKTQHSSSPEMISFSDKASTSFYKQYLESGSEDELKSLRQNGALKGGRPEHIPKDSYGKRFLGRKINKKVLDSDESEDDNPITPDNQYRNRCRPVTFSSSDSEKDFRQSAPQNQRTGMTSSEVPSHSLPYGDGFDKNAGHRNSRQYKNYRSNQKSHKKPFVPLPSSRADSSDGCDRQLLSSTFQCKNTAKIPCRTRRSPRMNIATTLVSNGFTNGNSLSAPVRGRRISGGDRGSRRSGSPHHRNHLSQHRSNDSKSRGRSVSASRSLIKDTSSYVARFPDVFDAEDSDNEFFTANSYSDTETSTESLGAVTINASFPNHRGTISCSIDCEGDGSTDDEIRVVFSTAPYARNNDIRRGASRTLGRRYNRGATPHRQLQNTQEVVSLSPDPVEQVRQVEEDERMARMLQAEFDAEVDPDYTPVFPPVVESQPDSDDEVIDPVGDSDSDGGINYHYPTIFGVMSPPPPSRMRLNRFSSRPGTPNSLSPSIYFRQRRVNHRRNRRIHFQSSREEATDFQIARLFGLSIPSISTMGDIFNGGDDYEALLSLDLGGEVIPRGLHKSDINRLPTRKYVHPNSASSSTASEVAHKRTELNKECQVCLTDYETGDILRILPCFHEFHTPCIDPWLKINHTCPVCRVTVDLDA